MVPKEVAHLPSSFKNWSIMIHLCRHYTFSGIRYLQLSALKVSGFVKQHCLTLCSLLSIDGMESVFTEVENKSIHFPNPSFNAKAGTCTAGILSCLSIKGQGMQVCSMLLVSKAAWYSHIGPRTSLNTRIIFAWEEVRYSSI